jgi:hypothetical protein
MLRRKLLMGTASLLIGGATLVGMSSGAWATGPTITVTDPGAGPFVQGSGFTHKGLVKVQEFNASTNTVIHTFKWTASKTGTLAHFAFCEGSTPLQFQAKDLTTGAKTPKTAAASYPC